MLITPTNITSESLHYWNVVPPNQRRIWSSLSTNHIFLPIVIYFRIFLGKFVAIIKLTLKRTRTNAMVMQTP